MQASKYIHPIVPMEHKRRETLRRKNRRECNERNLIAYSFIVQTSSVAVFTGTHYLCLYFGIYAVGWKQS